MTNWTPYRISVADEAAEEMATKVLIAAGCQGVQVHSISAASDVVGYIVHDDRRDARLRQIETALQVLSQSLGSSELRGFADPDISEEDWANGWKKYFKPTRVGRHLLVRPAWEPACGDNALCEIIVDPGMAFGTGSHPTTQLCLCALEDYVSPGQTVADIGTGSGILAICAHKLGASLVYATDTDPTALLIAQKNAQVNGTDVLVADSWPTGRVFDVVVANILADTLIRMADDMASITAQGGIYIASGIIEGREDTVRLYSEAAGFTCLETKKQGEWLALVFRKATS